MLLLDTTIVSSTTAFAAEGALTEGLWGKAVISPLPWAVYWRDGNSFEPVAAIPSFFVEGEGVETAVRFSESGRGSTG
jgi:hypothetical protein